MEFNTGGAPSVVSKGKSSPLLWEQLVDTVYSTSWRLDQSWEYPFVTIRYRPFISGYRRVTLYVSYPVMPCLKLVARIGWSADSFILGIANHFHQVDATRLAAPEVVFSAPGDLIAWQSIGTIPGHWNQMFQFSLHWSFIFPSLMDLPHPAWTKRMVVLERFMQLFGIVNLFFRSTAFGKGNVHLPLPPQLCRLIWMNRISNLLPVMPKNSNGIIYFIMLITEKEFSCLWINKTDSFFISMNKNRIFGVLILPASACFDGDRFPRRDCS